MTSENGCNGVTKKPSENGCNGVSKKPPIANDKSFSLYSVPIHLLILAGSTWSGLACVAGASVVAFWQNNWVLPSLLSALWFCGLPALVTVVWLYLNKQSSRADVATGSGDRVYRTLKIELGPEAWSQEKLPSFTKTPTLKLVKLDTTELDLDRLIHNVAFKGEVNLRPNVRSNIPLGKRRPLVAVSPKLGTLINCSVHVKPSRKGEEAEVQELRLDATRPLSLLNVVPTLVNLHDIVEDTRWALSKEQGWWLLTWMMLVSAKLCQWLLHAFELIAEVRLQSVHGCPKGSSSARYLALYFSGHICLFKSNFLRIPFWYIWLPGFVLPCPHSHLSSLLSEEPLTTARIRNPNALPLTKIVASLPELISSFKVSFETVVEPPILNVETCLEDATLISADFSLGSWSGQNQQVHAKASMAGTLNSNALQMTVDSLDINGLKATSSLQVESLTSSVPFFEALAAAALAESSFADPGAVLQSGPLAKISGKFEIDKSSPLLDLYAHGKVRHPLMNCGHECWGAARKLTFGGSFAFEDVQLRGRSPSGGALHVCLPRPPVADFCFEAGDLEIPGEDVFSGAPRDQNEGSKVTKLQTGRSTTQLILKTGMLRVCMESRSDGEYLLDGSYSGDLYIGSDCEVAVLPEFGLLGVDDSLQIETRVYLAGDLHAKLLLDKHISLAQNEVLWRKSAIDILSGTCITGRFSATEACLGSRVLCFPNDTSLAINVPELHIGSSSGLDSDFAVVVRWQCGDGSSPTLADMDRQGLQKLDLLPRSMRSGAVRVCINSVGRMMVEVVPKSVWSAISPMTPSMLVLAKRYLKEDDQTSFFDDIVDWKVMLHSPEFEEKVLLFCNIMSADSKFLQLVKDAFQYVRRGREIIKREGINDPKDIIPAEKLTDVISKVLSDDDAASLYKQLHPLIRSTIEGNGIDVPRVKELLVKHLPYLEDFPYEIDRILRLANIVLSPTPALPHQERKFLVPLAQRQQFQNLLRGLPSASEIYAVVDDTDEPLPQEWAKKLASVAPYLTLQQLEYILHHSKRSDWPSDALARLTYVLNLKREVLRISADWGDVGHLAQTQVVAILIGKAVHASLDWPGRAMKSLPADASFIACIRGRRGGSGGTMTIAPEPPISAMPSQPMVRTATPPMVRSPSGMHRNSGANHKRNRRESSMKRSPSFDAQFSDTEVVCDSLLSPSDVAALLRSGLAGMQSYVAQANFRMLIELTLAQPPVFLRGVLFELSDYGSHRALAQMLLRLVNVEQTAFLKPMDIEANFERHLGVTLPCRQEYLAGGRWCTHSYYEAMIHAAVKIIEEAELYLAVQSHLQVAAPALPRIEGGYPIDVAAPMSFGNDNLARKAINTIRDADAKAKDVLAKMRQHKGSRLFLTVESWRSAIFDKSSISDDSAASSLKLAIAAYHDAFAACRSVLRQDSQNKFRYVLGSEWFKEFWNRNHEALMVECLTRAVQNDVDEAQRWFLAQPGIDEKSFRCHGCGTGSWENTQWLIDRIIDVTYFYEEDRKSVRQDPLARLLIENDPSHRYDFSIVSCMGVVTEGAAGTELQHAYKRCETRRGVKVIRADTRTAKSHEWNAAKVEEAIRKVDTKAWGVIGYSQGGANVFKAESRLCGGTPEQRKLTEGLCCRNFICSNANGTTQATCGEWKITKLAVELEKFLKHYQVHYSKALQETFLDMLLTGIASSVVFSTIGGIHSLTYSGVETLWREAKHKDGVPTTSLRGVVEKHSMPESLELLCAWYNKQLESTLHDSQVVPDEAVGHPVHVHNSNSEMLQRCDLGGLIQRMNHWGPLKEETAFITTAQDLKSRVFDFPKDRFVFPWLELNARFGFIPKTIGGGMVQSDDWNCRQHSR